MAYSKARRLSDLISADGTSFVTAAHITDGVVTAADLHQSLDLTGKTVTVATASGSDNDTTVASTAFVQQEIASLVASAPGTLNTLNELAAALGDDASFSTTVTNSIATKLPLAGGTLTGALTVTGANNTASKLTLTNTAPSPDNTWALNPEYNSQNLTLTEDGAARVTFKEGGNVGIGTNAPTEELHVSSAVGGQHTRVHITKTANAGTAGLSMQSKDASAPWTIYQDDNSAGDLNFYDGSAANVIMKSNGDLVLIDTSQKVGIGTAAPVAKLQIGAPWVSNSSYGNTDIYIKETSPRSDGDPQTVNTSDIGLIITKSSTNTDGPTEVGLVLHNDDNTVGAYSPMLLFTKRESGASPYKATMAGIWAEAPTGTGQSGFCRAVGLN